MPSEEVMARQEALLEAFVDARGDLDSAREVTKTPRKTFFDWLRNDDVFRTRFDEYRVLLAVDVENEAVRRVLNSDGGRQRGTDALATTLLKGLKGERYAENQKGNQQMQVVYVSGLREKPRPGVEDVPALEPVAIVAAIPATVPE